MKNYFYYKLLHTKIKENTSKCEAICSTSDQSTSIVPSENEVTTNINESHQHTRVSTQVIQDELICEEGSDQTTQSLQQK